MKLPCIECVTYAICKQKESVDCSILFNLNISHEEVFKRASFILPKMKRFCTNGVCVNRNPTYYQLKS